MSKMRNLLVLGVLAFMVVACAGRATPTPALSAGPISVSDIFEISWQWAEQIESEPAGQSVVPDPANYTLLFLPDGTLRVRADCNTGTGTYKLEGNKLVLELGAMTVAMCPPDSLHDQFLALLGQVDTAAMDKSRLVLALKGEAGRMVFDYGGPAGDATSVPVSASIDPGSVVLDTMGLPFTYQPALVPATAYDDTQSPGPTGLPEHVQAKFVPGSDDLPLPEDGQSGDPVIYLIPVEAYKQLWEGAGNPSVAITLEHLQAILAERPSPVPPFGMPVLPFEEVSGVNDLAVQGEYLDLGPASGVRFVGRFVQDATPVTNEGLRYIFQGLSSDGTVLVAFFYPVTTADLANPEDVTAAEQEDAVSNLERYLSGKVEVLDLLEDGEWEPALSQLDAVLSSLTFETAGAGR